MPGSSPTGAKPRPRLLEKRSPPAARNLWGQPLKGKDAASPAPSEASAAPSLLAPTVLWPDELQATPATPPPPARPTPAALGPDSAQGEERLTEYQRWLTTFWSEADLASLPGSPEALERCMSSPEPDRRTPPSTWRAPALDPGGFAYLRGLVKRPELNDEVVQLVRFDVPAGRWVCVYGDEPLRLRPNNLVPMSDEYDDL